MNTISVDLTSDSYQIYVGHHLLAQAGKLIRSLTSGSKILLVTHPDLNKLYGAELLASLESAGYHCPPAPQNSRTFEYHPRSS